LKELEKAFGVSQQTVAGITYRLAQERSNRNNRGHEGPKGLKM
jgi:hypothetical protein